MELRDWEKVLRKVVPERKMTQGKERVKRKRGEDGEWEFAGVEVRGERSEARSGQGEDGDGQGEEPEEGEGEGDVPVVEETEEEEEARMNG